MTAERIDRWWDRPPGGADLEDLAAERFREVRVPPIDEAQLARVALRIDSAADRRIPWLAPRRLQWAVSVLLLCVALTAGATLAGLRVARELRAAKAVAPAPAVLPPPKQASDVAQSGIGAPAVPAPTLPRPKEDAPVKPTPTATSTRPPRAVGGLTGEARLLHDALEDLNVRRKPASALAKLELYGQRYPSGVLAREADVARVDALLRLGQPSAALGVLDRAAEEGYAGYPRPTNLRVLRGELLAKSGRCREAARLFGEAIGDPEAGRLAERALYGRATCRAELGDVAGSRDDFTRYLALYPRGHFAADVGRALGR